MGQDGHDREQRGRLVRGRQPGCHRGRMGRTRELGAANADRVRRRPCRRRHDPGPDLQRRHHRRRAVEGRREARKEAEHVRHVHQRGPDHDVAGRSRPFQPGAEAALAAAGPGDAGAARAGAEPAASAHQQKSDNRAGRTGELGCGLVHTRSRGDRQHECQEKAEPSRRHGPPSRRPARAGVRPRHTKLGRARREDRDRAPS